MSAESQTSTSFVAKFSDTHQWEGCPWNSFAGSVITEAGSAVHRAQLVLEVADALVDGERPSQSCLQQQREIGRSARSKAGLLGERAQMLLQFRCFSLRFTRRSGFSLRFSSAAAA